MPAPALVQKHALNAVTAVLFGLAFWRLGLSPELPAVLAFIFGGVLLAVIDWKVQRLPTRLVYFTLAGVGAGLALRLAGRVGLASAGDGRGRRRCCSPTRSSCSGSSPRSSPGCMLLGFGDVRLAAVLGLLLGWYGLEYVLYGAIAGHVLALLLAAVMSIQPAQAARCATRSDRP